LIILTPCDALRAAPEKSPSADDFISFNGEDRLRMKIMTSAYRPLAQESCGDFPVPTQSRRTDFLDPHDQRELLAFVADLDFVETKRSEARPCRESIAIACKDLRMFKGVKRFTYGRIAQLMGTSHTAGPQMRFLHSSSKQTPGASRKWATLGDCVSSRTVSEAPTGRTRRTPGRSGIPLPEHPPW
jgi:hypothetical protein